MLSHDIRSLRKFLELAATAQVGPAPAALRAASRMALGAEEQALRLEAMAVPRRQRISTGDLGSGKITLLAFAPRKAKRP